MSQPARPVRIANASGFYLRALNFVITGLLGNGVADATRPDPQAKGLGEYIRSRHVDLPAEFIRKGHRYE